MSGPDTSFFGFQVVLPQYDQLPLWRRLHHLIAKSSDQVSVPEKLAFWKRFTAVLTEGMPVFEYGYWDYISKPEKAAAEFESWATQIEGNLATEAEELGEAADEVNRLTSEPTYLCASLFFLVVRGSNSDRTLAERCAIPEAEWWTRQTFGHLLATVPLLNFGTVQADAVYLVPGNDQDGLSSDDLYGGGFKYLKPLS